MQPDNGQPTGSDTSQSDNSENSFSPTKNQPAASPSTSVNNTSQQQPYSSTAAPENNIPASAPMEGSVYAPSTVKKKKSLKKILPLVLVAFLLLGGGAAAYVGLVVPNKPEKVWSRALDNSAKGYDKLFALSEDDKNVKGADFKGTFKADGQFKTDGSFEGSFWEDDATFKMDVGLGVTRANVESRFIKSATDNPDVYVNVSGLKGLDQLIAGSGLEDVVKNIDGKWVVIDHTLLDNIEKQAAGQQTTRPDLTPEDMKLISDKAGEALDTYIFTEDPTKAVFTVREAVGKEERDGRSMYHFKVALDKQHLKDFVTTFKDKMKETKIKDLLGGRTLEEAIQYDEMLKQIDALDTSKPNIDAWVDLKTKLFHAIRVTNPETADTFVEFGVPYTGGEEVPFVVKFAAKERDTTTNFNMRITGNEKTEAVKMTMNIDSNESGENNNFEFKLDATPRRTALTVEKPANAMPLLEALGDFGPFLEQMFNDDPVINDGPITPGNPRIGI